MRGKSKSRKTKEASYKRELFKFCKQKLLSSGVVEIKKDDKSWITQNAPRAILYLEYEKVFKIDIKDDFDPKNIHLITRRRKNEIFKSGKISKENNWRNEYEKHLNSPKWKKFRSSILKSYDNICQKCKNKFNAKILHVHHLHYNTLGDEKPEDVLLVCKPCHEEIHGRKF